MPYDTLPEPADFDWGMHNTWMSSGLTADPWDSSDLAGLPSQVGHDENNPGPSYFG